jgi:hypothetical protein
VLVHVTIPNAWVKAIFDLVIAILEKQVNAVQCKSFVILWRVPFQQVGAIISKVFQPTVSVAANNGQTQEYHAAAGNPTAFE